MGIEFKTPLNSFAKSVKILIVESNTKNPNLVGSPLFYMELLIAIDASAAKMSQFLVDSTQMAAEKRNERRVTSIY